jgi:mono/diheme cytochrome c family protein
MVMVLAGLLLLATTAAPAPGSPFYWRAAPSSEGVPRQPRPASGPELRRLGATLYGHHCSMCHGPGGKGDGPLAARLAMPPRDLSQAVFKVRTTPSGSLPTDLDLFQTVSRGFHGTDMHPWARLSERERWALVLHLQGLAPRFAAESREEPVAVPPSREAPAKARARGAILYTQLQCGNCHGAHGRGDGPGSRAYASEREVRIRDLVRSYYVRGDSPRDVFITLRTGMDGTPMAAYDLPADDLWALAHYVADVLRRPPPPQPPARAEDAEASH